MYYELLYKFHRQFMLKGTALCTTTLANTLKHVSSCKSQNACTTQSMVSSISPCSGEVSWRVFHDNMEFMVLLGEDPKLGFIPADINNKISIETPEQPAVC